MDIVIKMKERKKVGTGHKTYSGYGEHIDKRLKRRKIRSIRNREAISEQYGKLS